MEPGPFSTDELDAQFRAGVVAKGGGIRSFMPDQHRAFFASQRFIYLSLNDENGWPIATLMQGDAGFISSPDAQTLRINAVMNTVDPAHEGMCVGVKTGLLGIDFTTRRRNRVNGVVTDLDTTGITIKVEQSFGNCPKYITSRMVGNFDGFRNDSPQSFTRLPTDAARLIALADTFFIATTSGQSIEDGHGMDMSHRGGEPGFVHLHDQCLTVQDFPGNRYFNTLGNLLGDPRAGLLFIDFETGSLLQLQGTITIDWDHSKDNSNGAERQWHFQIARGWYHKDY